MKKQNIYFLILPFSFLAFLLFVPLKTSGVQMPAGEWRDSSDCIAPCDSTEGTKEQTWYEEKCEMVYPRVEPISVSPEDENTCPPFGGTTEYDDWKKADGLSGLTYTYTAPEGSRIVQTCYKASTSVIYSGEIVPPVVKITVTSTVDHDLSHASFRLVEGEEECDYYPTEETREVDCEAEFISCPPEEEPEPETEPEPEPEDEPKEEEPTVTPTPDVLGTKVEPKEEVVEEKEEEEKGEVLSASTVALTETSGGNSSNVFVMQAILLLSLVSALWSYFEKSNVLSILKKRL